MWFVFVGLLPPVFAAVWILRQVRPSIETWRKVYLPRLLALTLLGGIAGAPFWTSNALGTGEALNYSWSTADAIAQFRAGEFPVLVGQSQYAFMGRIHPLRTAPYFNYLGLVLDTVTFRQLSYWSVQNLALALSFMAAAFSTFACLRRATAVSANWALSLTGLYLFSPGVMAVAYSMDLYMTVMVVPFLPVVLLAHIRLLRGDRGALSWTLLAMSLAATWCAHPPVALWVSLLSVVLQIPTVIAMIITRDGRAFLRLLLATSLGGAMAAYTFASALSISSYGDITGAEAVENLLIETHRAFAASLLPVSASANALGDFQAGYTLWAGWVLAGVLSGIGLMRGRAHIRPALIAGFLWLAVAGLLLFVIPIPGVHDRLWHAVPTLVVNLTNQWPMQRLYLVICAMIVFLIALTWPTGRFEFKVPTLIRDGVRLVTLFALGWTLWQALPFLSRALNTRHDLETTARIHAAENLDPIVTSYANLGTPDNFVDGVTDPEMELMLRDRISFEPVASNWDRPAESTPQTTGTFKARRSPEGIWELTPTITLNPNVRYRLDFEFLSAPQPALLQLKGSTMLRNYALPEAGGPLAFGMQPGNRHSLPVWSSEPEPQTVQLRVIPPAGGGQPIGAFANFSLTPLEPESFPLRVESLTPLRIRVRAPRPALLQTFRMMVDGYAAKVDGVAAPTFRSPDGRVTLPVPAGESVVEVSYPGPTGLRPAFWLSLTAWSGAALFCLGAGLAIPRPAFLKLQAALRTVRARQRSSKRAPVIVALALLTIAGLVYVALRPRAPAWQEGAGALRISAQLPLDQYNLSMPILTTGVPRAGTFIYVITTDRSHIQLGLDVWGLLGWVSEPIAVDYYQPQEFVISSEALFPLDAPAVEALSPAEQAARRKRITVDLNGQRVLDHQIGAYDSPPEMISVGENHIGGSNTGTQWLGEILSVERLPVAP